MSVRYEWTHATHTSAAYVGPGMRVDGEPAEHLDEEGVTDTGALVLGYDEAFVIEGTLGELRDLIDRMRTALPPL